MSSICIGRDIAIDNAPIKGIYLTKSGKVTFEVAEESLTDFFDASDKISYDVLERICEMYTSAKYGQPMRIIDVMAKEVGYPFGDAPVLKRTIEGCLSPNTILIKLNEDEPDANPDIRLITD